MRFALCCAPRRQGFPRCCAFIRSVAARRARPGLISSGDRWPVPRRHWRSYGQEPAVELILPSGWLPVILGGQEPEFETEDQMRTVLGTIMGRYNEIAACLSSDPDDFDPLFLEGLDGDVIASDWAGGFLDAVALRATAWEPLIESDGAGILMALLFLLTGDMEIDDAADEDELMAQASDMIPTRIAGIREFWQNYRKPPSRRGRSRTRGRRRSES
jgi:uncharacterized protein